jgi:hypothetical protein
METDGAYPDDYSTCARTYASLLIRGGSEDPEEVTAVRNVEPTTMRSKRRQGCYAHGVWSDQPPEGRPVRVNVWDLTTEGVVQSRDSRRHVDWLLDVVKEKTDECAQLRARGWSTEISVFWHFKSGHGGPTVEPSSMRIMADLGITLWFDVYDSDSVEDESEDDLEMDSA